MLHLLDDDILAVEHDEHITGSELTSNYPPLDGRIEGMLIGASYGFAVNRHMNKLVGLVVKDLNNRLNVAPHSAGSGGINLISSVAQW